MFVNCPFDEPYKECFTALLFTITMCGYQVRCALEEDDAGDVRFDKLCELVGASDRTIHDLSRIEVADGDLPRFNMPFELGLMMGARRFGRDRQRSKRAMIMIAQRFVMPRFLSDLAGNDPQAHDNAPQRVVEIVRNHLHTDPAGHRLPGAAHIARLLDEFRDDLPNLAGRAQLTLAEVDVFAGYRNFMDLLRDWRDVINHVAHH